MDDYLDIVRSMKPKPNVARRSYQPLNPQQNMSETTNYPQRASLNPGLFNPPRPSTTLINNIPAQPFNQNPVTYSMPYSVSPQNIAPSSINYLHEDFPVITTTTSQFIPRPTQSVYQSSFNNMAPPASEMQSSTFNQFSQINQRNRVSPQQENRRKTSFGENERRVQKEASEKKSSKGARKSKRKSQRNKYLLILTGMVVFVIALLAYKSMNEEKHSVVFCDTGEMEREGCVSCPLKAECRGGSLKRCDDGFTIYKNRCVKMGNLEGEIKFDQYLDFVDDLLARRLGDYECGYRVLRSINHGEVRKKLHEEFQKDSYFSQNEKHIFEKLRWLESNEKREVHPYLYKDGDKYYTDRKPDPSALCRIKLLWKEKVTVTLVLVWILLFVLSVEYGRRYILKKREYQRLARELYNEILVYLSHWEKIRVKQLKKDFEEWAQGYSYRRLWRCLEEIKKKDCKIYSYLDYYQNNVEEFWMLPK